MDIYTNAKISPVGKINPSDLKQVLKNMTVFLIPLALIYLLQINGILQTRALNWGDLIPTKITQGAIELYCINALMDLLKKFTNL